MKGKTLLVTGGTGTLGMNIMAKLPWRGAIRALSRDEQKQQVVRDLNLPNVRLILGDIRDVEKLRMAMRGVHTVIHTAALKIVPNSCYNPDELVLTNAVGTLNVVREAIHAGVERVIVIGSDKGVEPTTLYGATKMCAEQIAVQANNWSDTKISVVRFGNIEESRGSITEWMDAQVAAGAPIPITDVQMTRFWVTQNHAIHFLNVALERMEGGEIFVPKLVAKRLMDMLPEGATHYVIGLRQSERTYEPLVGERELHHADEFDTHFVIRPYPYKGNTRRINAYRSDDPAPRLHPDHSKSEFDEIAGEVQEERTPPTV